MSENLSSYKSEYSYKLRDPKWQEKRHRIMERDENMCLLCDSERNLHVHHKYYEFGKDPWEYPDDALMTLCRSCHEIETKNLKQSKSNLINILCRIGLTSENFDEIYKAVLLSHNADGINGDAFGKNVASYIRTIGMSHGE